MRTRKLFAAALLGLTAALTAVSAPASAATAQAAPAGHGAVGQAMGCIVICRGL